ncbi:MAG: GumC family protein, partial [Bacteroidota bacterium]
EQEQGGISPMVYVFKILYFWPYLVVALILGLAGAFVYNRYAQPVYKINSSILIIENKGGGSAMKNLDAVLMSGGLGGMTSTTDNELGIIQSFTLVDLALKELDFGVRLTKLGQFSREEVYPHRGIVVEVDSFHPQLVDLSLRIELQGKGRYRITENGQEGHLYDPLRYTYRGEEPEPEMVASDIRSVSYAFGQWVEGKHHRFRLRVLDAAALSGSNYSVEFRSHRALQDEYFGKVKVEPWKKMASLLYLTLEETNIEKGQRYVNKLMEVYLRQNLELKNQTSLNTVGFIDRELSGISDSLQTTESRLEQFRSANRTVNISSEGQVIFSRLEEYEKNRALEQGKLKYYDYLRNYLSENRPAGEVVSPSTMGVQDPVLIGLIQELGKLSGERNAMAVGTRRSNPYLEQLDEKIRLTNSAIRENLRNLVQNSQILIRDLEGRIRSTEGLLSTLPRTERDLVNIKRKFTLNENLFVYLLQKRAEAGITMAANLPDARV